MNGSQGQQFWRSTSWVNPGRSRRHAGLFSYAQGRFPWQAQNRRISARKWFTWRMPPQAPARQWWEGLV